MKTKGQAALEYMLITGFMLVVVAIIFSIAIISQDENMKIRKANDSMAALVNAANEVYARGTGNILYTRVNWPDGVENIWLQHKCNNGDITTSDDYCDDPNFPLRDGIDYSAIMVGIRFFGGSDEIMYESKAPLLIDETSGLFPLESGEYIIKVEWTTVGLERRVGLSRG